jgi:hypothetical protein
MEAMLAGEQQEASRAGLSGDDEGNSPPLRRGQVRIGVRAERERAADVVRSLEMDDTLKKRLPAGRQDVPPWLRLRRGRRGPRRDGRRRRAWPRDWPRVGVAAALGVGA